ncbi:hypothetical protein PVAG01_10727 [Phlyctema vagabunda]|uniref:Uncharacterized protein n=1 Tax=Phlyctema vagabunda TaxID=108571 RepID=A0ABR4P343_9HELO
MSPNPLYPLFQAQRLVRRTKSSPDLRHPDASSSKQHDPSVDPTTDSNPNSNASSRTSSSQKTHPNTDSNRTSRTSTQTLLQTSTPIAGLYEVISPELRILRYVESARRKPMCGMVMWEDLFVSSYYTSSFCPTDLSRFEIEDDEGNAVELLQDCLPSPTSHCNIGRDSNSNSDRKSDTNSVRSGKDGRRSGSSMDSIAPLIKKGDGKEKRAQREDKERSDGLPASSSSDSSSSSGPEATSDGTESPTANPSSKSTVPSFASHDEIPGYHKLKHPQDIAFVPLLDRWLFHAEIVNRTSIHPIYEAPKPGRSTTLIKRLIPRSLHLHRYTTPRSSPEPSKMSEFFVLDDGKTWVMVRHTKDKQITMEEKGAFHFQFIDRGDNGSGGGSSSKELMMLNKQQEDALNLGILTRPSVCIYRDDEVDEYVDIWRYCQIGETSKTEFLKVDK